MEEDESGQRELGTILSKDIIGGEKIFSQIFRETINMFDFLE